MEVIDFINSYSDPDAGNASIYQTEDDTARPALTDLTDLELNGDLDDDTAEDKDEVLNGETPTKSEPMDDSDTEYTDFVGLGDDADENGAVSDDAGGADVYYPNREARADARRKKKLLAKGIKQVSIHQAELAKNVKLKRFKDLKAKKLKAVKQDILKKRKLGSGIDLAGPNEKYCCGDCGKLFAMKHDYLKHIVSHVQEDIVCELCSAVYKNENSLRNHQAKKHNVYSNVCEHCGRKYANKRSYEIHKNKEHMELVDKEINLNSVKGKRSRSREYLDCEYCGNRFKGTLALTNHIKRVHLKKFDYSCKICRKAFFCNALVEGHMLTVHTRRCDKCENYVSETEPWKEGMGQRDPRVLQCPCGNPVIVVTKMGAKRKFARKGELVPQKPPKPSKAVAAEEEEDEDGSQYMCAICDEVYATRQECEQHQQVHMMKFICGMCDRDFDTDTALQFHMARMHDQETASIAAAAAGGEAQLRGENTGHAGALAVPVNASAMEDENGEWHIVY